MVAVTAPAVVPVAGAAFVRPIKAGDGVRMYGSSSGSVGLKPAAAAGSVDFTLPAADGTSGQALVTNGSAVLSFATISASPGGSNTQIQFNDSSSFGGDASLIWNKTDNRLGVGDTTAVATPAKHMHIGATTNAEGLLVDFVNDNHTTTQAQIEFRNARGTHGSKTSSFSGSLLNRVLFSAHDGTTYRPAASIEATGLNNPAGGQSYFPGKLIVYCGSYDSTMYVPVATFSGGNAAFTAVPRVSFGNGTVDGNLPLEITMASTADAAIHMQNGSGDASIGIDSSGRLQITRSGFISSSTRMVMTGTQTHWVQDTNVYGTGEVTVEGDGTGILFGVCRQGTPGANVIMTICDWSTNRHIDIYENGGAVWNIQQNNADFIIHGDNIANSFVSDASVDAIGIGIAAPLAKLHVHQTSTTGAKPVLTLNQADVDEDFFKFIGTSDTSADRALVDAANFPNPGSIVGWLKINVQDDQGTNPIADGDYYLPFYSVPTA